MNIKNLDVILLDESKESLSVATFTAEEITQAEKEFQNFLNRKGRTWNKAIQFSKTKLRDFIELYFGEIDEYCLYLPFDAFKGTNKTVTEQAVKLFRVMEYHDRINQDGCCIEVNKNGIAIISEFDY